MQTKKIKPTNQVHVLTQKTSMKFIPLNFPKQKIKPQSTQMANSVRQVTPKPTSSLLSSLIWKKSKSAIQSTNQQTENHDDLAVSLGPLAGLQRATVKSPLATERSKIYKLKFAYKLSSQHMLIGNEFQLDLISIVGINSNHFVQTEFLWSIGSANPISLVGVDHKKQNLFAIVAGKNLLIYKYDAKKLTTQPLMPFKEMALPQEPKFLQIVKDGNICLFFQQRLQIYLVAQQVRKRYDKKYPKPEHLIQNEKITYSLFMVPEPYDNILNVFFEERNEDNRKIFTLWCLELEFLTSQIPNHPPQKIYDIKSTLRNTISLKNFSKEIFLLNLGSQILALKRGYILDSATVNLKHEESFLQYIGNETLLHISQKKIEVYAFVINITVKPFRILIKPKDSIRIQQNDKQDEFFKVFQMLSNDLLILYQKNTQTSLSKSGEIQYSFYVTRSISRQAKMNLLFPLYKNEDLKIDDPVILDKCDMAEKMGLTTREIYLQLWSRSLQSRKEDYSILIATKDYNTINQQIIRKLKKASMNFKQIQNIEQACFVMLEQKVFSSSCTEEAVMDYISSHFFRRKLQMFKDIQLMEKFEKEKETGNQENEVFKMTIRQYQEYKSMEIKSYLIQLVNQFCHEGKKSLSKNIRFLLRSFKFVFRTIYYDLLESIIKNAKDKLLDLLNQIPELLPYHPVEQQTSLQIPVGFYEGVWPEISRQEWNTSLYIDAITTIDNKEIIMQHVIKSINFKRNWLSQHDMVIDSVEKIKANYQKIKSPLTFYFFAAKMFEYIQNKSVLREIVDYLEATYQLPANLRGTIFLNERLYKFFIEKNIAPQINGRPYTLNQFFSFEDKQLIRHCFDKERSNKGLLLKDIKGIFKQVLEDQADQKYNTALLNYFTSDLSQVSDLKYILNRINNQKLEFHHENQKMYVILVEALERKLKIGTGNDIPIEQVLIYIENIPLDQNSAPLHQLKAVEKIEKESQLLRKAQVNMSIYDILHNEEQVFTKLISHVVDSAPSEVWQGYQSFNKFAIESIANLEVFAQQIYETNFNKVIFLSFLSKVCQVTQRIKFADYLLRNNEFAERVNENTTEGLVLLMYKWKLSQQKQFVRNEQYLKQLLKLLPTESNIYKYNKNELQFAKILSAPNNPVTYPISEGYITAVDVRDIIYDLPIEFVMQLDILHLHEVIAQMEDGLIEDLKQMGEIEGVQQQFITAANRITLHQLYEFVIVKMINSNKLREVLPYIRNILELQISDTTYNIIYLILYIIQLAPELAQSNKNNLLQCISHYFYDPKRLLQIIEYLMTKPLSTYQVKAYIQNALQTGKQKYKGYNESNPVFDENCLAVVQQFDKEVNFMLTLNKTAKHIQQAKEEFKNVKYSAIMIMLCNSPYALAKYISCSYNHELNVKSIRSFLSYAIGQNVFKPLSILELGRRIFLVLLESLKNRYPIQIVIQNYTEGDLENDSDIEGYQPPEDKTSFEYLMWKSAQAFKKKKQAYAIQMQMKAVYSREQSVAQKTQKIRSQLDPSAHVDENPCQYPFNQIDSDNQINDLVETDGIIKGKKKAKKVPEFDASQEMKSLLQLDKKSHKLFHSTRGDIGNKNFANLSISIRQPGKATGNSGYESHKELKSGGKSKQRTHFQEVAQLGESQNFNDQYVCQTDRQLKLRPTQSAAQSDRRHSADSSPEIKYGEMRLDDNVIEEHPSRQQLRKNSGFSGDLQEQVQLNNYEIKVKEVFDPQDEDGLEGIEEAQSEVQPDAMVESTEFTNTNEELARVLTEINKQALQNPISDFNLQLLQTYANSKDILIGVLKQLYKQNYSQSYFNRMMKLIGEIVNNYPVLDIDTQIFGAIIKAQEAQAKTIPQIKFQDLISEDSLVKQYKDKRDLFQQIYHNLSRYVDSENIYKITQFIRRVFDNPQYEQEVTWDFILELCDKIQTEQDDRNWNIQKIQANLAKVSINVWNRKFDSFQTKALNSTHKDTLLQVFCNYLKTKTGNQESITFLQKLSEVDQSKIIRQTLSSIKK